MKLKDLLDQAHIKCIRGSLDKEIKDIVYDSRKAGPGAVFVAINGFKTDSHRFLGQTAEQGATAAVIEKEWAELDEGVRRLFEEKDITVLKAEDGREALALLSAAFFGYPTREMTVVGVTGTKGKTTTTSMLAAILRQAGYKVGVIGTNGVDIGGRHIPSENTTPEPYLIQQYARMMVQEGCRFLIMEASSTGIKFHRTDGIDFDIGLFTNLSPDHIGTLEHPDFEDYRDNKAKLFARCRRGILNRDDEHFETMLRGAKCEISTFGMGKPKAGHPYPDLAAKEIIYEKQNGVLGSRVRLEGSDSFEFFVSMPGDFNVCNALGAVAAARALGVGEKPIREALKNITVAARVETLFSSEDLTVILDYAHNEVSATALLSMLRAYHPGRIVVIFGAEGERAQIRRKEMGETCGRLADFCILSSQNPGDEPIEDIFREIHHYLDPSGTPSVDMPDRAEAIRYALKNAQKGDILAVIGKGDENYDLVRGVKHPWLDRDEIDKALRELGFKE